MAHSDEMDQVVSSLLDRAVVDGVESKRLQAMRETARAHFVERGIPPIEEEDWRFTNLGALRELSLHPAGHPQAGSISPNVLQRLPLSTIPGNRLVFLNGYFIRRLSSIVEEDGVQALSLAEALSKHSALCERYLGHAVQSHETPFAALNTALFKDGAFLHISAGKTVREPLHLVFLSTEEDTEQTHYPRNLIVVEGGAHVTLTESYHGAGASSGLTCSATELIVGEGARVEHVKVQDENESRFHLGAVAVQMARESQVRVHSLALGAKLSRTTIYAGLVGQGVECLLNGLYIPRNSQLADHFTIVDNAAPHGISHEYFNGILAGQSRGVFHGRIIVRPGAQKTDAKQTNKNLLLSDTATIDTKPQLEIYADDVKCTHGTTVGQLNPESLFYMRARGLPLEMARHLLIVAFAEEILNRIRNEDIRGALSEVISKRLGSDAEVRYD